MRLWRIACGIMVAGVALGSVSAQNAGPTLEAQLQRVIQAEMARGDCPTSILEYQRIVDRAGSNRRVAAEALLRIAECHRRIGDDEAKKVYSRIVAQFGDQEAAAVARSRITPRKLGPSNRAIWEVPSEPYFWGDVSADGRYIAYGNQTDGDIYVHDFETDTNRRVTRDAKEGTPPARADSEGHGDDTWSFSKDGKQLAYSWRVGRREELRIISLAPGQQTPRTLLKDADIRFVTPFDWSPDGKSLSVGIWRNGRTDSQLTVMSLQDASTRPLKTVNDNTGASLGGGYFSPDGRFIAFSPHQSGTSGPRDVFLVEVATGREIRVTAHPLNDALLGWAPDGSIVFISDRTGSSAIWTVPFANGVVGTAQSIDVTPPCQSCQASGGFETGGFGDPFGLSASGAFYYRVSPGRFTDVKRVNMNFETGTLENRSSDVTDTFIGTNSQPQWSPDGRSLAFLSERPRLGRYVVIRTVDSAATKEIRMNLDRVVLQAWSPDGSAVAVVGQNASQPPTLFRVDTRSGEMTELARNAVFRQWSGDGKKIVFDRQDAAGIRVVERDLSSGAERDLHLGAAGGINRLEVSRDGRTIYYRDPVPANAEAHRFVKKDLSTGTETVIIKDRRLVGVFLSPDERYIATQGPANVSPRPLLLVPTDGSESRDLGQGYGTILAWAPDSRSIIVTKPAAPVAGATGATFWWVPIDGRPARQLILAEGGGTASAVVVSGRGLAFQVSTQVGADVVWALENFLPKPAGRGAGGR